MVSAVGSGNFTANIEQAKRLMGLDGGQDGPGSGSKRNTQQLISVLTDLLKTFMQTAGSAKGAQGQGSGASGGGGSGGSSGGPPSAGRAEPANRTADAQPNSRGGARDGESGADGSRSTNGASDASSAAGSAAPVSATPKGSGSTSVAEAAKKTKPKNVAVLRGDEKQSDDKVKSQADFGRLADKTAKEYGLDPNLLRAEMEKESNAFTKGYEQAMSKEGDLDRQGEGNTSIGIGQISRNFLDGGEWSDEGPNNPRAGGQSVSTEQYNSSVTTQVRLMASNLSMRAQDHGGLEGGLAFYVNGTPDTSQAKAQDYLQGIDEYMNDAGVTEVGR